MEQVVQWNQQLSLFGLSVLIISPSKISISTSKIAFSFLVCAVFLTLFTFQLIYTKLDHRDIAYIVMKGYLLLGSNIVSFFVVIASIFSSKSLSNLFKMIITYKTDQTEAKWMSLRVIVLLLIGSFIVDLSQFRLQNVSKTMVLINSLSIHISFLYILLHIQNFTISVKWMESRIKQLKEEIEKSTAEVIESKKPMRTIIPGNLISLPDVSSCSK